MKLLICAIFGIVTFPLWGPVGWFLAVWICKALKGDTRVDGSSNDWVKSAFNDKKSKDDRS